MRYCVDTHVFHSSRITLMYTLWKCSTVFRATLSSWLYTESVGLDSDCECQIVSSGRWEEISLPLVNLCYWYSIWILKLKLLSNKNCALLLNVMFLTEFSGTYMSQFIWDLFSISISTLNRNIWTELNSYLHVHVITLYAV